MKTLMFGECAAERTFGLRDPNFPTETEFEYWAAKAIACAYPDHVCVTFGGSFQFEGQTCRPDLALVAKDFSHWFVIEIELITHSLELHVLPQLRCFRYGQLQADCSSSLSRGLGISLARAQTLVRHVPREVAVVANKHSPEWRMAFRAIDVQLLIVSVYDSAAGQVAFEVEGELMRTKENVGFGEYSATDRSIRFHRSTSLPIGRLQLADSDGAPSWWIAASGPDALWVTKETGSIDLEHGSFVQIVRKADGKLTIVRIP